MVGKIEKRLNEYLSFRKDIKEKLDKLKIEIDKKYKFKAKGIIINYKHVKNMRKIIIIDERVSEHLEDYRDLNS